MKIRIVFAAMIVLFCVVNVSAQKTDTINNKSNEPILTIVEQIPLFPGGEDSLFKYLNRNIKYPQAAKERGISGVVIITFVVEKDGSISNIMVLKSIGGGCDEEAVRVAKKMPKWKPGMQNGKAVRVQFNLPIKFSLK